MNNAELRAQNTRLRAHIDRVENELLAVRADNLSLKGDNDAFLDAWNTRERQFTNHVQMMHNDRLNSAMEALHNCPATCLMVPKSTVAWLLRLIGKR